MQLGAKMVDFFGWQMPLRYPKGTVAEHMAVRNHVGIFDVSHMARILIEGKDAASFLDFLSTNHIADMENNTIRYAVWCNDQGYAVDDTLIYRQDSEHFFVVANASNRTKDLEHLMHWKEGYRVKILPLFEGCGILALQGPESSKFMEGPKKEHTFQVNGSLIVARSGYTGSLGFEVFGENAHLVKLWDELIQQGVEPIGLGARDTLRLEMGYALYGHELSHEIKPIESVAAWTIKNDKEFLGKEVQIKKRFAASVIIDEGIAREQNLVWKDGSIIGFVTSGSFSPMLQKGIALILVEKPLHENDEVQVEIRSKKTPAKVVKLPFYKGK